MAGQSELFQGAPAENFSRGLLEVEIPELGTPTRGKVRDNWVLNDQGLRILAASDRKSAYDRMICTIPGVGQVLNLLSAHGFKETAGIVPNHMIDVPHPNILVARQAEATLPVEVVLRRYMAKSSTKTSIYYNYAVLGRRRIYGIDFPEGLVANQEFPDSVGDHGTVITPTTKAEQAHDEELTDYEAAGYVYQVLGTGVWGQAKEAALALFEHGRQRSLEKGLLLVDTKYEFGLDSNDHLMLIDELHTPDSSRFWLASSYQERFNAGATPETFDKEILRRWLAEQGFKGEGPVPVVDPTIINQMSGAYMTPYWVLTGQALPKAEKGPKLTLKLADILP